MRSHAHTPGRPLAPRLAGLLLALLAPHAGPAAPGERHPARSPAEALRTFQLESGLRIELVAAEPLVVNPVAFVFDGPHRLFVAEGRGYPDPIEGGAHTTAGRIALLEDRDGDGRFERRTDFATGLGYVNGLALWRGGVFVTAAPDLLYLKDTDGDGVADVRTVVLTGFDATKTAQLRVSHPTFGLDGKIYVTSGLNGGKVSSPDHPGRAAVTFSLKDGRFDPDTYAFENTSGRGQFGRHGYGACRRGYSGAV
jgi:putative membrane-bound dehydrogenase-like protein